MTKHVIPDATVVQVNNQLMSFSPTPQIYTRYVREMDSCRAEACQKGIEKIVFALNAEWCCFARRRAGGVPGSLTGWGGGK